MSDISPVPNNGYISLPVSANPNTWIQQAFADIQAQISGWVPREGELDVIVIEEAAQMMSVSAQVAAQAAVMIFCYYGVLVGVLPILGTAATVPGLFTMTDDAGYTIQAGTVIAYPLSGNQVILFTVQAQVNIAPGSTTGTCLLVCTTVGSFPNGLAAATCAMNQTFAQVASIATTAAVSGGVDPDTQTSYINRLSNELQLLAPRPILASDYAAMAPNVTGVYRALAIDGLNPGRTITDAVLNSTTTITSATADFTTDADVGRSVGGNADIPSSTTITSVTNATTAVLSHAATASAAGQTLVFGDLTGQQRYVTVCGIDVNGNTLSSGVNTALQTYLASKREVNFVVATISPTYTEIDVSVTCFASPGAATAVIQASIATALNAFLNAATWGGGSNQTPAWSNTAGVVRFTDVVNVIRTVPGVLYIPSGDLTFGIHGDSLGTTDVTLPGDAPLPQVGALEIFVTAS
jgi:hypothetical protein